MVEILISNCKTNQIAGYEDFAGTVLLKQWNQEINWIGGRDELCQNDSLKHYAERWLNQESTLLSYDIFKELQTNIFIYFLFFFLFVSA